MDNPTTSVRLSEADKRRIEEVQTLYLHRHGLRLTVSDVIRMAVERLAKAGGSVEDE